MSTFGLESVARSVRSAQTDEFQRRAQIAENSTRFATNSFVHNTEGVGDIVVTQPILFDCVFVEEPIFTSGSVIVKQPDLAHYHYPLANAGVYRWLKRPQKPPTAATDEIFGSSGTSATEDRTPQFFIGAYVYFVVRVDPQRLPRGDGSNLSALRVQLGTLQQGTPNYLSVQLSIIEAEEAIYLNHNPARCVMQHHLVFQGVAQKALGSLQTDLEASF